MRWIMNIITYFRTIMHTTLDAQALVMREQESGVEFDRRLMDVAKATMDGEGDWFLNWVRKRPDCAIDIIKECDIDDIDKST